MQDILPQNHFVERIGEAERLLAIVDWSPDVTEEARTLLLDDFAWCCDPEDVAAAEPPRVRDWLRASTENANYVLGEAARPVCSTSRKARAEAANWPGVEQVEYPTDPQILRHSTPVPWGAPEQLARAAGHGVVVEKPRRSSRPVVVPIKRCQDGRQLARLARADRVSRAPPGGGDPDDPDPDGDECRRGRR